MRMTRAEAYKLVTEYNNKELCEQYNQALDYASRLAKTLQARLYPNLSGWEVGSTLIEILLQIDNMTCDLVRTDT